MIMVMMKIMITRWEKIDRCDNNISSRDNNNNNHNYINDNDDCDNAYKNKSDHNYVDEMKVVIIRWIVIRKMIFGDDNRDNCDK